MIFSLCSALASFAQGNGMAGISEATNMVTSYFDPLTKLIFAVAAILGLVGGVRVYSKFSSGDPDASKSATALFLSCVFLVLGLTFVLPLSDGRIPSEQGRGPSGRVSGRARNGSLANASIARR